MIKAVIFDLDNTLYDYDACNIIAEKVLFETIANTFNISENEASKFFRNAKENIKSRLGEDVASSHNRLLYMQSVCEQAGQNPIKYAMRFYDVYWNTILSNMKLFDYVQPLISYIKGNGKIIGILTDLTAHIQYRKIKKLGLEDQIDYLVTSEEAGVEKPSKKIFELMLEKMKVSPQEVLMIGDSISKDINGARAIGMEGILYDRSEKFIQKAESILG